MGTTAKRRRLAESRMRWDLGQVTPTRTSNPAPRGKEGGKDKQTNDCSWLFQAGKGNSSSVPGVMTALPRDSHFTLRILPEVALFIPLIDGETTAQSVCITHLLGAQIKTWSGQKEAVKPRHIHLALVSSPPLGGLFQRGPACFLVSCCAILDPSLPKTMQTAQHPWTSRGLGQTLESLGS